jgi:hypothetical protein
VAACETIKTVSSLLVVYSPQKSRGVNFFSGQAARFAEEIAWSNAK